MSAGADTVYLTRHDLAAITGISASVIREWEQGGLIPSRFCTEHKVGSGRFPAVFYDPVVVAVCELMVDLGAWFGFNSKLPRLLAPQIIPTLEAAWRNPTEPMTVTLLHGPVELRIPLDCVARAYNKIHGSTVAA